MTRRSRPTSRAMRGGRERPAVADAAVARPTTRCSIPRSPTSTTSPRAALPARSPARCSCKRFVDDGESVAAFRHLRLDAVGQARPARRRRMPGRARALCAAGGALWLSRHAETAWSVDPRLTPARPDLAARHLAGQVEAARFVEGTVREVVDRAARRCAARRRPTRALAHRGAEGRARHDLRDERRRLGLGPARRRRLCRLAAGARAAPRPARAPTHKVAALRTLCVSRPLDQAAAGRDAAARRQLAHRARRRRRSRSRADGGYRAGAASRAARRQSKPISSRSPSASSARPICGAARPASASTARAWCRLRSTACGIACPRDSDMQEQALGRRSHPGRRRRRPAARRSDVLERPCRHRARRRDASFTPTPSTWRSRSSRSPKRLARIAAAGIGLRCVKRVV